MKKSLFLLIAGLLFLAGPALADGTLNDPAEQEKLAANIRKSLSVPPQFLLKVQNFSPSPVPGLMQGTLELSLGTTPVRRENLYVSPDGRYYLVGNLFDAQVDMDAVRRDALRPDESPSIGGKNAAVTVVEFSDYQCESCKYAHDALVKEKFFESYGDKVRFVPKNFPISRVHKWSQQASVAAMCAYREKPEAFWVFHDGIFLKQNEIVPENLRAKMLELAKQAGLNAKTFSSCYDQQSSLAKVNADLAEGQALGVMSTPTFVVNGRVLVGFRGSQELRQLIDEFLAKSQSR
jgi:protein-disulfide isomerase